ncbi:DNA-processing protein DprA, partial [uncultured Spongiibacter sp.]|uniref:DNA-processing protein DprA n=1 Tax=uncultured Spongiibacter sp. TaxID=870896 RepID=UPI00258B6421
YPDLTDVPALNPATLKALRLPPETAAAIQAWQSGDSQHPVVAKVATIQQDCKRLGISVIASADPLFPDPLRHIHDAPLVLYTQGDSSLLSQDQIGVVGSRHATRAGLDHARTFAAELSRRNLVITSGLALGVDGAAHTGAMQEAAASVAVLGCGVDICYPRRNKALYDAMGEGGLVLSEYPLGSPPLPHQFPRRNRIISGMSLGVLVIEAAIKSGSLITARQALEQNREVFALPGSIHSPASRGCNALIRQGAKLVETLEDIVEELPCLPPGLAGAVLESPEAEPPALLALLEFAPLTLDQLATRSTLPVTELLSALGELELAGWVEQCSGGWQRCR